MLLGEVVTVAFSDGHEFTSGETKLLRKINKFAQSRQDSITNENARNREHLREYLQEYSITPREMSEDIRHITPWGMLEFNLDL